MAMETDTLSNQKTAPSTETDRRVTPVYRSALLGILSFFILALLFTAIIYQRYTNLQHHKREEVLTVASNVSLRLQESLTYSLSATKTLSFFIQQDGTVKNFDSIASQILSNSTDIDALQLVPDGVIKYIYPLKGNEKVLGYDILRDAARNKEAYKAIGKNELYFAGPFALRQGGMGVVGRLPVFRNNKFWGFSAVVIKMPTLLKAAGIDSSGKTGYYFQLSKINPDTKKEEFFIPHNRSFSNSHSVSVIVPNGEWKLSAIPVKEFKGYGDILILGILGLLFSILGGVLVYNVSQRPKKLDELVKTRTRQLEESEKNYKVLFERSPLPLWIYDLETLKFLQVNDAAINLYGYSRNEFLDMDVLAIRPEADIQKFMEDNEHSSDELREAGVWTHLKKNRQQVQVLVFSRNIFYNEKKGKLVLLMDVSEKIKVENDLIKSEEKYRSLIEQASDGIILYSFDGRIHSFNKAAYMQTGYTREEFETLNLRDLLFEKGVVKNRAKENKVKSGQSAILYRKLKRKDGAELLVELNTRMLPDGNIFAIVRDITDREKAEAALVKSEEQYRSLIERVTDAFISLDNEGNFTYVNKRAGEIYKIKPETLVGKNIWTEFPDGTDRAFFNKCNNAIVSQEYQYLEEYYPPLEKWFENHIYPSKDGLTIFFKDVTELKKAAEEIKKSNERFELIAQATNEAIWDHDFAKNETWGNNRLYNLYGFAAGENKINYEMFLERIHPDESKAVAERMKVAIGKGTTSLSEEFRFKTNAGEYRNFYDRAYIKYDEAGNPLRVLGAMQDITDREEIKKQILKEKELSDSIINSLPGIFYLYNKEGKFLRWNKNFENVSGYKAEDISNMHPLNFFDTADHALLSSKISNVFVSGFDNVEANFLLKSGEKIPYYFTGQAIEYEGQLCLMGVGLDFSEREKAARIIRESEEKYRTIIDQASDGIFVAGDDTFIIDVNTAGCKMLGYTKEELKHIKYPSLIPAEDVAQNPILFEELKKGQTVINERRLIKKDGSLIDVEISATVLFDGRFQSIVRDITERKKAAEEIKNHSDVLRELYTYSQNIREEERTYIAREIHDELGQQLTGLKMDISWINRRLKTSDEMIQDKLISTLDLVDTTIRTVRKIATELRPSILDDLGLVAALEWQGEEYAKRFSTKVDFTSNLDERVIQPDITTALFRIYQELLTNIARHSQAGTVNTAIYVDKEDILHLSVADNGTGFDIDNIATKKTLGLRGIKERTNLIGGIYEIKTKPGGGTFVLISVPLHNSIINPKS